MRINDIDLQNVTPEEVAYILSEGSPKLVSSQTGSLVARKGLSDVFISILLTTMSHLYVHMRVFTLELPPLLSLF